MQFEDINTKQQCASMSVTICYVQLVFIISGYKYAIDTR